MTEGSICENGRLQANDQVHRARGPMGLTIEQAESVNDGEDAENPNDERAPVQRLVMHPFGVSIPALH